MRASRRAPLAPGAGGDAAGADRPDSAYAWWRLLASLALSTMGGIGLWSVVVSLPAIQAEFGVDRADASLPYTATMVGFAVGGVLMGRLADRFGVVVPAVLGALMLGIGYVAAASATALWQFMLAQALLIGMLGSSATFGPLVADVSLWFVRRRGIAVAIVASGNYLAGTIWPPLLQAAIEAVGLASGARRHRRPVRPDHAAARARPAPAGAGRGCRRAAQRSRHNGHLAHVAGHAPGPAGRRRPLVLHRHVDAAGAPRRLLRRPRLRAGARRRDALAHAGFRRGQPHRLGPDRRSHRRRRHFDPRLRRCNAWRSCFTCRSTASPRSTWSPRCSGCRRAASCRATR